MEDLSIARLPSSLEGHSLHTLVWNCQDAKAVVVFVHGMSEHIARYDGFARFLNSRGIAAAGASHLGHGLTAGEGELGYFAKKNGAEHVVKDIDAVRRYAQSLYPGVPCFMLGHSMGSFLTRYYLCTDMAKGLSGAVLSGTADQPAAVLSAASLIAGTQKLFGLSKKPGKLLNSLSFSAYNKPFDPPMDGFAWLSREEENVKKYVADPLCGFCFTVSGFSDLFKVLKFIGKDKNIRKMDKSLPVLLAAGACDPVGENGAGVKRVYERFKKDGLSDVSLKLYENDRHEILNEIDRETVYEDIYSFFERIIAAPEAKI